MSEFPIHLVQHISDKDILFKKEQANYDSVLLTKDSLFVMKHRMLRSEKFQKIDISNIYSFEKIGILNILKSDSKYSKIKGSLKKTH